MPFHDAESKTVTPGRHPDVPVLPVGDGEGQLHPAGAVVRLGARRRAEPSAPRAPTASSEVASSSAGRS